MSRRAAILAIALSVCVSCGGSADAESAPIILRVSAGHDLGSFEEGGSNSGASAYAFALFHGEDAPFRYDRESSTPTRVHLQRREEFASVTEIETIEIREISQVDEWRGLHGRTIDVIPSAPQIHQQRFDRIDSIRVVPLEKAAVLTLVFNMRVPSLSDVNVRRLIGVSLHREAISRIGCGHAGCASSVWATKPPSVAAIPPKRLSLLVLETDSTTLEAAVVIRLQLAKIGIEVETEKVDAEVGQHRVGAGDYDMLLVPLTNTPQAFLDAFSPRNVGGYDSEQFILAWLNRDFEAAKLALASDVPAITLYEQRSFAAIDRTWCGGTPSSVTSWTWLKDLRPCDKQ